MRRFILPSVIIVSAFVLMSIVVSKREREGIMSNKIQQTASSSFPSPTDVYFPVSSDEIFTPSPSTKKEILEHNVLFDVPFVVQAPRHNWNDIIYQNACEEAAVLMAMHWVQGRPLTSEEAYVEIKKLSDYSQEKYGFHLDQAAEDVARLIRDYYDYENVEYRDDIKTQDIKEELMKGNLVLVPVNGRKLGNPFFTAPGPTEHMLVIKGYDVEKKEFISNDSGIGKGNGYRYEEGVLDGALQRYPSGYHGAITEIKKVMIIVSK